MTTVAFTLNGRPVRIEVSTDDIPLVFVLRDRLRLTGTKYSCLEGVCGACTIHIDGSAARACITPVGAVAGRTVTTIEGLFETDDHPLFEAWIRHQVPQCGYCQPGQLMQAAALLTETPAPSEAEIAAAMAGNLCRCGTTPRIIRAIAEVVRAKGA